jgi:hypothetical protein
VCVGPENETADASEKRLLGSPLDLTLGGKLVRCQVPERAVWPALIVVDAPRLDLGAGMLDGRELVPEFNAAAERTFGYRRDEVLGHQSRRTDTRGAAGF